MATASKPIPMPKPQKPLPAPNSDFYELVETLPAEELAVVKQVRTFMETKVAPIITKYWIEDAFPFELLPALKELNIGGVGHAGLRLQRRKRIAVWLDGHGDGTRRHLDRDILRCALTAWQWASIYLGGSEEQKKKWLPPMARWEKIGCFGLTEPLVGSGASGGLTTTAKREGDTWIINGQKRWIGNSPWCDISIIWARDVADNQVKAFIVENKTTPGFKVEKIQNKIALKVVQNGQITMENCRIPEENRLQGDNSFRDTAKVLSDDSLSSSAGKRRDAPWALTRMLSSMPRSACSLESRSARFSSCRTFSPRCLATSPLRSAWWFAWLNCKPKEK